MREGVRAVAMTQDEIRTAIREELAGTGFKLGEIRDWARREDGGWTCTVELVTRPNWSKAQIGEA